MEVMNMHEIYNQVATAGNYVITYPIERRSKYV